MHKSIVEPPFWYAGMHNPELQIMFYGKKHSAIWSNTNSIAITNLRKTENPNYLFVTINTKMLLLPKSFSFRNKIKLLLHINTA
jgi:hypothetical protein